MFTSHLQEWFARLGFDRLSVNCDVDVMFRSLPGTLIHLQRLNVHDYVRLLQTPFSKFFSAEFIGIGTDCPNPQKDEVLHQRGQRLQFFGVAYLTLAFRHAL